MTFLSSAIFEAFCLCFAAMAALSLSMDRHYEQATGRYEPSHALRWTLRVIGTGVLGASIWPCFAGWGWTVGFVVWWGFLTAGAMAVVLLLLYRPRWTINAALASAAAALCLTVML